MNKRSKRRVSAEEKDANIGTAIISALYGLVPALIAVVVLSLAFSAISLLCPDPREVSKISGYAVLLISSFVGGFLSYKRCGQYPLVCGLAFGGIYLVLHCLASLVPISEATLRSGFVWMFRLIALAIAIVGAFLGTYKPKKRHRAKRKR